MKKDILIVLVFLLNSFIVNSQDNNNIYLSDFEIFVKYLEETHPDPYTAFGGKMQFAKTTKNTKDYIIKCANNQEFKELLNDFIAKLEDGHTFIYQNNKLKNDTLNKFFPLTFKVAKDGLFIDFTSKKYTKHIGSKLLKINNLTLSELLSKIKKLDPIENHYGALYALRNRIANFKYIKRIIGNSSNSINLTLQDKKGKTYYLQVDYSENPDWIKPKSKIQFDKDNDLIFYKLMEKDNAGYFAWNAIISKEVIEKMPSSHPQFKRAIDWTYSIMQQKKPKNNQEAIEKIPDLYKSFVSFLKQMKKNKTEYLIMTCRDSPCVHRIKTWIQK